LPSPPLVTNLNELFCSRITEQNDLFKAK